MVSFGKVALMRVLALSIVIIALGNVPFAQELHKGLQSNEVKDIVLILEGMLKIKSLSSECLISDGAFGFTMVDLSCIRAEEDSESAPLLRQVLLGIRESKKEWVLVGAVQKKGHLVALWSERNGVVHFEFNSYVISKGHIGISLIEVYDSAGELEFSTAAM